MRVETVTTAAKPRAPVPLYHQLYVSLREKILSGEWQPGDPLPSEQEISISFKVSRVTVRRALDFLVRENLVRRFQGRGSFVSPKVAGRPVTASIAEQFDNALSLGRQTTVKLSVFEYVAAPPDAQRALCCAADQVVQWSVRVRHLDHAPLSQVTTYLPEAIGRRISRKDLLSSQPILWLVEQRARITHADQVISATLADEQVSGPLKLPVGAPLLAIERVVLGEFETPIMFSRALYNPDYYRYRLNLEKLDSRSERKVRDIYD